MHIHTYMLYTNICIYTSIDNVPAYLQLQYYAVATKEQKSFTFLILTFNHFYAVEHRYSLVSLPPPPCMFIPLFYLPVCKRRYPVMSVSLVQPHPSNSLDKHYNMPMHTTAATSNTHIYTYTFVRTCASKAQYHLCNTLEYCIELANIYYLIANIVGKLGFMPVHHYRDKCRPMEALHTRLCNDVQHTFRRTIFVNCLLAHMCCMPCAMPLHAMLCCVVSASIGDLWTFIGWLTCLLIVNVLAFVKYFMRYYFIDYNCVLSARN